MIKILFIDKNQINETIRVEVKEMNRDWLKDITRNDDLVDDFIDEYRQLLESNKERELAIQGNLIQMAKEMPTIMDKRFSQFEDVNSVLNIIEIKANQARSRHFAAYSQGSARAYSSRDIEKFIDGEADVVDLAYKQNKLARLRNQYAALTKGLSTKEFQLTNITKLKVAGLDDSEIF